MLVVFFLFGGGGGGGGGRGRGIRSVTYIHVCVKSHVSWVCVVVLSILGARLHTCVC